MSCKKREGGEIENGGGKRGGWEEEEGKHWFRDCANGDLEDLLPTPALKTWADLQVGTLASGDSRRVATTKSGHSTLGPFRWGSSDGASPSLTGLPWRSNVSLGASINPGQAEAKDRGLEPTQRPLRSPGQGMFPLLLNVASVPLTHTGCAVLIGLKTPTASLIGPAPVASIRVDTHGLVSRAYERELDTFIGVCKAREPLTRARWAVHCPSLGSVCPPAL